jgi:hypothetical protein
MRVEQQAIINAEARALPGGNRHAGGAEKRRSGSVRDRAHQPQHESLDERDRVQLD